MLKKILLLSISLFFIACPNGGTSVEPTPLKTLYFIDSPVNGLDYTCGVRNGITKHAIVEKKEKNGVLYCSKGAITFSLGSLVLGSIEKYKDKQEIRPQDLIPVPQDHFENEQVLKIALLLQSLDDNGEIEESINIDNETKAKLTQNSLDTLSLSEISKLIIELGKTPRELNEVKKHLIRNSSISYEDAKPKIIPFSEDIATASSPGFTIGNLSIDEGKAPILSLTLEGKGSENFQLNKDGKLVLLKKIDESKTYHFEVTAENIYGIDKELISINFIKGDKLAKVQLGMLINATVKIIKVTSSFPSYKQELIFTEQLSSNSNFNTHAEELEDDAFYIFEVRHGEIYDSNNDGIKEKSSQEYKGTLRLFIQGSSIKNTNKKIYISPLSEILYDYIVDSINEVSRQNYGELPPKEKLEQVSQILLKKDLNSDNTIDSKDVLGFNSIMDKQYLYQTLSNKETYEKITKKLINNDMSYLKDIFESSFLEKFLNTDIIKIDGRFAYIYGQDSFYIYDLINHEKLGSLSLPKTNIDALVELTALIEDSYSIFSPIKSINYKTVSMYLDINQNYIFLSNLNAKVIAIDIHDFNNPILLMQKEIGVGKHISEKYNNMLFFSEGIPSLFQETVKTSNVKILDIQDIQNPKVLTIPNFPYIKHIKQEGDTIIGIDIFTKEDDSSNAKMTLKQYELNNLRKQNSAILLSSQTIETFGVYNQFYFDSQHNLYSMSLYYGSSLSFYDYNLQTFSQNSTLGLYREGGYIYNRNKDILYISGVEYRLNQLSLVNLKYETLNQEQHYLYSSLAFEIEENYKSIYFYDNIFTTNQSIIDTRSYLFSQRAHKFLFEEEAESNQWYQEQFEAFTP